MRQMNLKSKSKELSDLLKIAALAMLSACFAVDSSAQQKGQKTFSSPEEASRAVVAALQNNDEKVVLEILGADATQIVSSGDSIEDAESHANFVRKYEEMHRFLKEPDGSVTLYIGAENWPTPIPLAMKGSLWFFDTEAGMREILFRRIGRNEYSAIRICQELVAAQKEYYAMQHNEYAKQIYSDEGQHNGLYWKVSDGEPQSPIGPLVASAVAEGYVKGKDAPPTPYRGYFFHILPRQGKAAPGGIKSYIVKGKMSEGFAFVAYPAEYRSSGVMTFIVNQDGVVYQKDLGKKTEALGKAMQEYNPDSSWQKAEEVPTQTAAGQKLAGEIHGGAQDACLSFEIRGTEGWLRLTSDHPYGFRAGDLKLTPNVAFVPPKQAAVSGGFMGAAINVGEVYAHLARDAQTGKYSTPGFDHALHNSRLIEAVRHAAERGERQKIVERAESLRDRVTPRA